MVNLRSRVGLRWKTEQAPPRAQTEHPGFADPVKLLFGGEGHLPIFLLSCSGRSRNAIPWRCRPASAIVPSLNAPFPAKPARKSREGSQFFLPSTPSNWAASARNGGNSSSVALCFSIQCGPVVPLASLFLVAELFVGHGQEEPVELSPPWRSSMISRAPRSPLSNRRRGSEPHPGCSRRYRRLARARRLPWPN